MPQPRKPVPVNTPIGATGGKPIDTGRTKPVAGNASEYMRHMIEADQAYHAKQGSAPARGSSGGLGNMLAKGTPPVGIGGRQREASIMNDVDKMAR